MKVYELSLVAFFLILVVLHELWFKTSWKLAKTGVVLTTLHRIGVMGWVYSLGAMFITLYLMVLYPIFVLFTRIFCSW
jgi:hypothetical protein